MMMMAEMVDHKRRSCNSFARSNLTAEKRRRGGDGGGVAVSTREKKDKIGERVAKLQQLVSPFGKTDTASVLTEATSYINFLHDQLHVLSAPYLGTAVTGNMEEGDYYSLRRRGLCLVPILSTQKLAQSNGADLWAPVNSSTRPSNY
ncbi:transcription factor bHLH153-like [Curcuma longa]|uniref:transcription factor bHLH153-like n=1 Tax=Curcuma longa TaxID=136217 RepID=UPI003D9F6004